MAEVRLDVKQLERELDEIERAIALLKRDFEIYFAGASKLPPTDARIKLDRSIKKYATAQGISYAQRFRYNSLVARFNSYTDLWNKQLRAREEGKPITGAAVGSIERKQNRNTAQKNSNSGDQKQAPWEDRVKIIFEEYVKSRNETGEGTAALKLDAFAQVLEKQREGLREKYHCKDVEFYVTVEDGRAKLKARTVK